MRRWLTLGLFAATAACSGPEPESRPAFPAAEIRLAEWGLEDLESVRVGRLGEVPSEGRLDVHALWTEADLRGEPSPASSAEPAHDGACFVIDDLRPRTGGANNLGGHWGVFQREPSGADLTVGRAVDGSRVLTLEATRKQDGFCGAWMQLYDPTAPERVYLDATAFATLELWVRGVTDSGGVVLRIADERLDRVGDSTAVARLSELASFVDGWTRVVVRLDRLPPGLDRSRLASMALEVVDPGDHVLEVAAVGLCVVPGAMKAPVAPTSEPAGRALKTAMWVWHTDELLSSRRRREELAAFVAGNGVTDVLLQIPVDDASPAELSGKSRRRSRLRKLIARLGEAGARVHALDGHPTYAQPARLQDVLRGIDSVAAFNRESQPSERFVGVHYDIEPYLLPGFGSSQRARIVHDYLGVVAALAGRAREHGLASAVDIPFWFDSRDEDTGRDMAVELQGRVALPSQHVLDLVDAVYIMDYRTVAAGGDGILAHAAGELELAASGDTEVFVGLETHALPDERSVRFSGPPSDELPADLPEGAELVVAVRSGGSITLYLVQAHRLDTLRASTAIPEGAELLYFTVERSTDIRASRISFAGAAPGALRGAMDEATADLQLYPSFAGFAIHHYRSWRELLQRQ